MRNWLFLYIKLKEKEKKLGGFTMKRKLLGLFLLLFLLGGSSVAFAIWDDLEEPVNDVTVGIGQGVTLQVALGSDSRTNPSTDNLVPAGVVLKAGDVTSVDLVYNVNLDVPSLDDLNLSVSASNVQIGLDATYAGLVNIQVGAVDIVATPFTTTGVNSTAIQVTVTITLTEPTTQAEYNAIINSDITFDLTFTASQVVTP